MEAAELMQMRCAELEQQLEAKNPGYKNILREIHEAICNTPELLFTLNDAKIASIIKGLQEYTGVEIATKKAKEPITRKKAAQMTEDDV